MPLLTLQNMVRQAAQYLERNRVCPKHHVEHTGSNAYALDFYDYLHDLEKGKELVRYLLTLVSVSPEGAKVFYPGHLNPMNMSQNVIDTGTAVDTIARFARRNPAAFSDTEHTRIQAVLREVVEGYLVDAASTKPIPNQRLWGLTGVASYAAYCNERGRYRAVAHASIIKAFGDMTPDGFFRYYPNPDDEHSRPYDDISTFYQSRHTAFIEYVLGTLEMDDAQYRDRLHTSVRALLAMYLPDGTKDMRMECKRWYWLSSYEVASNAFDAFALAHASHDAARIALINTLVLIKQHFFDGFMHSHRGLNLNFQCPIFWTAHLAWLVRIPDIEKIFDDAHTLRPFTYSLLGNEVCTITTPKTRVLINSRFQERTPTTGILSNGLSGPCVWRLQVPRIPRAYLFSVREVLNHAWYALRGGQIFEAVARLLRFSCETAYMFLPRYCPTYGKITTLTYDNRQITVQVQLGSKYGSTTPLEATQTTPL